MVLKTIGLIAPSDPHYAQKKEVKKVLLSLSEILEKKGYNIIISPDKKSTAETFAKIHLRNPKNKSNLVGILYPDDKIGGYPGLNRTICGNNIRCKTYELQPGLLVRKSNHLICAGFSLGVFWEMCMVKYVWFGKKNSKVYVIKDLVSKRIPKEIECKIPVQYISLAQLERIL